MKYLLKLSVYGATVAISRLYIEEVFSESGVKLIQFKISSWPPPCEENEKPDYSQTYHVCEVECNEESLLLLKLRIHSIRAYEI